MIDKRCSWILSFSGTDFSLTRPSNYKHIHVLRVRSKPTCTLKGNSSKRFLASLGKFPNHSLDLRESLEIYLIWIRIDFVLFLLSRSCHLNSIDSLRIFGGKMNHRLTGLDGTILRNSLEEMSRIMVVKGNCSLFFLTTSALLEEHSSSSK